jgi:hypothetical protein
MTESEVQSFVTKFAAAWAAREPQGFVAWIRRLSARRVPARSWSRSCNCSVALTEAE